MYCSNCGKEIYNDQKFCYNCGSENKNFIITSEIEAVSNVVNSTSGVSQINTIFNRQVLNNYLNNLRTLEFTKNKLTSDVNNLEYRINSLGLKRNILRDWETTKLFFGGIAFMAVIFLIALGINVLINSDNGFLSWFNFLRPIVSFVLWVSGIIVIICVIGIIYSIISVNVRYNNEIKYEKERMGSELNEKKKLSNILSHYKKDLKQTEDLLNDAYAVNLIPAKYRNIYAVYFLYEYISTSTVTLNDALYHCDLDEISQKLNEIIEQQREVVMELAYSNALNEQIVQKNAQILKSAIATENNTALAAQYSQIAAINSNTTAQIQRYYFYKNSL